MDAYNIKLPALRKLNISSYTDGGLLSFCRSAPGLTDFALVSALCTDIGLTAIGDHCQMLENFRFTNAYSMGHVDAGITAIAKG